MPEGASTAAPQGSLGEPGLKEVLAQKIPEKRELLKKVKAVGSTKIGDVKVENTLGGMRYAQLSRQRCVQHINR